MGYRGFWWVAGGGLFLGLVGLLVAARMILHLPWWYIAALLILSGWAAFEYLEEENDE